jgi:uncharacterized membrane protein
MSKLIQELKELVRADVISSETAGKITDYLATRTREKPNRFPVVVNILATLLAGLGIVLLIAHNWDNFNRLTKTVLAFVPILLGQSLCAFVLFRRKGNTGWQECSAVFLFFGLASSISLVSQTYHMNGSTADFLLTWLLLSFPLIYIMPSSVVALLYIGGTAWYAWSVRFATFYSGQLPAYYPGLLALIVPHYYQYFKKRKESNSFIWLNWAVVISLTVSLGTLSRDSDSDDWISIGYLALFSVFFILGRTKYYEEKPLYSNPFELIGIIGILVLLFAWSFDEAWSYYRYPGSPGIFRNQFTWPFGWITIALLLVSLWRYLVNYRQKNQNFFDPTGLSGICITLLYAACWQLPILGRLLVNGWILLVAIYFIRKGAFKNHLGLLNFGLTIVAVLALCRFFDEGIPFVWRGFFFLTTGAGFFAGNYFLVKKRRILEKKD